MADTNFTKWPRVIGIVGGLGPYAHIEFERLLLDAAAARLGRAPSDQDYPAWLLVSVPETPDRTEALMGLADDPVPVLSRALRQLAGSNEERGADFAVIPCNTAHAFLPALRERSPLPILDMIGETMNEALASAGPMATVGLLATTGTLTSRVFHEAAKAHHGMKLVSLLDLENGSTLQNQLVMTPIYGPMENGRRAGGGIKSGPKQKDPAADRLCLEEAVSYLERAGAQLVILGCTEMPLALGRTNAAGVPLLDPMHAAAKAAIAIAAGERPLPE